MSATMRCTRCGRDRPRRTFWLAPGEWSDACQPCREKEPLVDWWAFAEELLYGHRRDYRTLSRAERAAITRTALGCAQYHQTRAGEAQAA